jgi:hypothetical protein
MMLTAKTLPSKVAEGGSVRLSVACGEELHIYDLLYPPMQGEALERALHKATKAFAQSFSRDLKATVSTGNDTGKGAGK